MNDHQRGCAGRDYTCTCGYEDARDSRIEAFKQEVSDALYTYFGEDNVAGNGVLTPFFITPAPKPDPLADAVESVLSGFEGRKHAESYANQIRAALEARGLEIREKG